MKNIMFIAPPAAGKGTQAEKIIEKYGFCFGHSQDENLIRKQVLLYHPQYIDFFDEGYNL